MLAPYLRAPLAKRVAARGSTMCLCTLSVYVLSCVRSAAPYPFSLRPSECDKQALQDFLRACRLGEETKERERQGGRARGRVDGRADGRVDWQVGERVCG